MSQRSRRQPPRKQPPRRPASRPSSGKGAARQAARQPAQAKRPFLTPDASPFRRAVELRSAKVVIFLRGLPRPVPGLLVIGLVAAGLLAPPVASGVALLLVAALLAWLVYLSWPAVPAPGRAVRLVVIAMVVAYALVRLAGT